MKESDIYLPLKTFLEDKGYEIKSEVRDCDVVGINSDGSVIAVEMKLIFGLPVIYQALSRLSAVDYVYIAVPVPDGKVARKTWDHQHQDRVRLCRMLGVGLISVRDGRVNLDADPVPYVPKKNIKARKKMVGEFSRRTGDYNVGGVTRRSLVTAYREESLRCALYLHESGSSKVKDMRAATGLDNVGNVMLRNVYGWFEQVDRGIYRITDKGREALETYADVVEAQKQFIANVHNEVL